MDIAARLKATCDEIGRAHMERRFHVAKVAEYDAVIARLEAMADHDNAILDEVRRATPPTAPPAEPVT